MSLGDLLLIVWIFSFYFYVPSIESNKTTSTLDQLPKSAGVVYLGFSFLCTKKYYSYGGKRVLPGSVKQGWHILTLRYPLPEPIRVTHVVNVGI